MVAPHVAGLLWSGLPTQNAPPEKFRKSVKCYIKGRRTAYLLSALYLATFSGIASMNL